MALENLRPLYTYSPEPYRSMTPARPATVIWRYQTLPKLLSLLDTRQLFFCRACKFEDRFEGAIPMKTEEHMRDYAARRMTPESYEKYRKARIQARQDMAISCWHISSHESAAMWSLYGLTGEGVAIKSTVERLTAALPPNQRRSGQMDIYGIFVGQVRYIDYSTATFDPGNHYEPYAHKREAFKHENELRAVLRITDAAQAASDAGGVDFEVTEAGIAIPVNVEKLIDTVYISPLGSRSFERVVCSTVERFGFGAIPVVKSPLAEDPIY